MTRLWAEERRRLLWRELWCALAEAQHSLGIVTSEEIKDLREHENEVDLEASLRVELDTGHDLLGELQVFEAQAPAGAKALHLGATSADIEDNADVILCRRSICLLEESMLEALAEFEPILSGWSSKLAVGYTHGEPALPITLAFRFASHCDALLRDYENLVQLRETLQGKGFRGAVGTSAGYVQLAEYYQIDLTEQEWNSLERKALAPFGISPPRIATQTYPRRQDMLIGQSLELIAASMHKLATDVRLLHSFRRDGIRVGVSGQDLGSSTMPAKRNPRAAESVCSLARLVPSLTRTFWDNAALTWLERSYDDGASRRVVFPLLFGTMDELLSEAVVLLKALTFDVDASTGWLQACGPQLVAEWSVVRAVRSGVCRVGALRESDRSAAGARSKTRERAVAISPDRYLGFAKEYAENVRAELDKTLSFFKEDQ